MFILNEIEKVKEKNDPKIKNSINRKSIGGIDSSEVHIQNVFNTCFLSRYRILHCSPAQSN